MELSLREEANIQFDRWIDTIKIKGIMERDRTFFIIGYEIGKQFIKKQKENQKQNRYHEAIQ